MKAAYSRPVLVEYGTMASLTHGASGDKPDFNIVNNVLVPDINNPTCTTNGPPLCGVGGGGGNLGGSLSEIPL
jgi:hypothetical protein